MCARCWLFGCKPDPEDMSPLLYLECDRCGQIMDYESLAGITRWNALKSFISYWLFRKWIPTKCKDCGKRYGNHPNCLPF